jgi:hypothetical protein
MASGCSAATPLIWIVMLIVFLALLALLSLIPIVGSVASLISQPILLGGMLLGCRALEEGDDLRIEHLFDGFRRNTNQLALVKLYSSLGYLLIALAVGGGALGLGLSDGLRGTPETGFGIAIIGLLMAGLFGMALALPVAMATWFAPALILFHDLPALDAMKLSFIGCLRNLPPFLVYGLITLLLGFLAIIPAGLRLLVLGPTLVGSVYSGYQDVFAEAN